MDISFIVPPSQFDLSFIDDPLVREKAWIKHVGNYSETWQPLDFAYSAEILRENDHNPHIIDANCDRLSPADVIKRLDKIHPEVIFIASEQYYNFLNPRLDWFGVKNLINEIKENFSNSLVVLSGPHPTITPDIMLTETSADLVIRGEIEGLILDIISKVNEKKLPKISGISYKDKKGKTHHKGNIAYTKDLDWLPIPAYDLIPMERYHASPFYSKLQGNKFSIVSSSRGCPFSCNFCLRTLGKKHRRRSLNFVIQEILKLNEIGIESIYFSDENFAFDRNYILEFAREIIEYDLSIKWGFQTRVDSLGMSDLETLSKSNCIFISTGVESASQQILDKNQKGTKKDDITKFIQNSRDFGIDVGLFMLLFLPGENRETLKESVEFINGLGLKRVSFNIAIPYPKTKLYEMGILEGVIDKNKNPWIEAAYSAGRVGTSFNDKEIVKMALKTNFRFMTYLLRHPRYLIDRIFNFGCIRESTINTIKYLS
ncbi:MAG: hypothetical protein B6U86_03140 [Candidatus Altiarchaeales archaeon ex4484_43]|nr:MAG: hypothetical protein B6U86_03140 [Candidatus Altiarchaeales archaeon ex4484_43]